LVTTQEVSHVQSFPITPGDPARQAVYERVSPEGQRIPVLSDDQQQVQSAIAASQAAARVDPVLNGSNAKAVRK
jgi:hypothetical protein